MDATVVTPVRSARSEAVGVLHVENVPVPVLRALSVMAAAAGVSRSSYVRQLMGEFVTEAGS